MRAITLALGLLTTVASAALGGHIPVPSVELARGTIASRFPGSRAQPLTSAIRKKVPVPILEGEVL